MEEDDVKEDAFIGEGGAPPSGNTRPAWTIPAPRTDSIGDLARRFCGTPTAPPDFTAAIPLVDEVRLVYGDVAAGSLMSKVMALTRHIPPVNHAELDARQRDRITARLRNGAREICRPFLRDFASVCGVLARAVELASEPVAPLETRSAAVEVIFCPVHMNYGPGDTVGLPDGRRGVIVTQRGADGRAGVMPHADGNGPPGMNATSDEAGDMDYDG